MSTSDETPGNAPPGRSGHSTILVSQVLDEQTTAWAQGNARRVEDFLTDYPNFRDQPELLLDLIQNEVYCRRRAGQNPELQEYLDRFPGISDKIKIQWRIEEWFSESDRELDAALTTRCAVGDSLSTPAFDVPETLGAYKILECLGRGGMGTVYKARHEHLGKTVAIKILSQRVTERPDAVARFKREMKAVGALNHPRIVQAFDAGEIGGFHYIAMELLSGADLHRVVEQEGPLSVSDACSAIRDVASALTAAHGAGLVHRDIKPSNMIRANGQVKLLDLGLARLIEGDSTSPNLTSVCQTFGTPDFMAPEQWDDPHGVDHRADLYALGCSLFFLLTGQAPYGTSAYPTASKKMKAHLLEPIPNIRSVRPDVPEEVAEIYRKLMAKLPRDRFASAEELQHALTPYVLEGTIISFSRMETEIAVPGSAADRAPSTLAAADQSSGAQPAAAHRSSGPTRIIISVVLLASLVIGGFYVLNGFQKVPHAPSPPPGIAKKGEPETPAPNGNAMVPETPVGATEHTLHLTQLIAAGPSADRRLVVSDGHIGDAQVDGERLSLDASGASRQLWLDFQEFDGDRMIVRLKLRIRNPEADGSFKMVMLAKGQWDNEHYFQIRRQLGPTIVNFSYHTRQGQMVLVQKEWEPQDQVHDVLIEFRKDKLVASIDGRRVLETARKVVLAATPALAVSGWHVDLEQPVVTLYEEEPAAKPDE